MLAARPAPDRWDDLRGAVEQLGAGDPEARLRAAESVLKGEFRFLGLMRSLTMPDWRACPVSRLWTYHLHYFDYAADLAWAWRLTGDRQFIDRFTELTLGWIEATHDGVGPGWHPYPTSVRVRRWLEALLLAGSAVPEEASERILASVAGQCAVLAERVEWQLRGNHLQRNLQALAQAGLLFEGAMAVSWRRAFHELWALVREQVLEDGTHYERSPMYHCLALGDLLEAVTWCRAVGEPVPEAVIGRLARMTQALAVLSRPDGRLHLFGDTADGIAPSVEVLVARARAVCGKVARTLPREGLLRLDRGGFVAYSHEGDSERIVITAASPSPSYQPAHSHADILSFELDIGGRSWIVDGGVSGYDGDSLRAYVRSTRAHNTVTVDDKDQSEMWATFRVGGRADQVRLAANASAAEFRFEGSYRPWHDRRSRHARVIERRDGAWWVEDQVQGAAGRRVVSFLHFAPEASLEPSGAEFVARADSDKIRIQPFGADRVTIRRAANDPLQGWHCPAFGVQLPAPVLELSVERNDGRAFGWIIRTGATGG
jgi:uncharacterized heparinase superfamily protein